MYKKGKRIKHKKDENEINIIINFIKTNKRNTTIISFVILIFAIIGMIYAFFSDIAEGRASLIRTGYISVELDEDSPFDDLSVIPEYGAETTKKTFRAISTGNVDCYVRAKIIPIVEYYDTAEEIWVVANISTDKIMLKITASDWIENNGYYYYKNILKTTEPENISSDFEVEMTSIDVPYNLKTEKIRTTIKVILEAAQYDYLAWKTIFEMDELPDGVEY